MNDETLATGTDRTLFQVGEGNTVTNMSRSSMRVLPEIRRDGDEVQLVPRREDRYEISKELGRGGMGEVSLATDNDIGRQIAVKRLIGDQSPHVLARFIDEVRTVGRMEHPNIVPVHDVGVDAQGRFFFVMKYVQGETLSSLVAKLAAGDERAHQRYGFEQRLDIFVGILNALQYAHGQRVLHRDVKPENVMIGQHGEVVLMDWGIARPIGAPEPEPEPVPAEDAEPSKIAGTSPARVSAETRAGSVMGTPLYMSPEQAGGATVELDEPSDLYSAFAVLFELLTLHHYLGECHGVVDTLVKVQEKPCPDVYDAVYRHPRQPPVPTELRHYLGRGLAKDPAARFQSSFEALAELARLRSGEIAVQCPVTLMKRGNFTLERFMDARPGLALFAAASMALLFIGTLAGFLALLLTRA